VPLEKLQWLALVPGLHPRLLPPGLGLVLSREPALLPLDIADLLGQSPEQVFAVGLKEVHAFPELGPLKFELVKAALGARTRPFDEALSVKALAWLAKQSAGAGWPLPRPAPNSSAPGWGY